MMSTDTVTIDRRQLLQILVQVENALEEIKQLKKELKQ